MTTPVNASVLFVLNVLKMRANLGGKSDPSKLPILLVKSSFLFLCTGIGMEVFSFFLTPKLPSSLLVSFLVI